MSSGNFAGFVDHPWTSTGIDTQIPAAEPKAAPPQADPTPPQGFPRAKSPTRSSRESRPSGAHRDELPTIGIGGPFGHEAPEKLLMLQYYDGGEHWRDMEQIQGEGHTVGRASFRRNAPAKEFLALKHFRIEMEGDQVFVEEGTTINGVYRKVAPDQPVELADGARFQVGHHVIEFRTHDTSIPEPSVASFDGEVFRWRRLEPLAYLDFIGPDNEPGIKFPLTKVGGTSIGRDGDIELTGDTWASRVHARVVRQGGRFLLEDLNSTNGTFVRIAGRTPLKVGNLSNTVSSDILLIGSVLVRVIEL